MKNDTTTIFLNFVLAALVIFGVFITILNMSKTRELRQLNAKAMFANNFVARIQALAIDTANYNAQAKNPDLAKILQSVEAKPAGQPAAR